MEFPGNPSQKIVSIAVGEAHTLALTGNGSVFSWGRGMFGRLGTGSEADELSPVRIKFGSDDQLVQILGVSAGAYHSLALADDGSVWSWGYNILDGQLGHNGDNSLVPHLVELFPDLKSPDSTTDGSKTNTTTSLKVSTIKAGGMMSLAIDNHGTLWMWGNCPQNISNSEGKFSLFSSYTPIPVREFHGHTVVKVACGHEHIVALVSAEGKVKRDNLVCYSWGNNHQGQLGLGDTKIRFSPAIIEAFNSESPWTVYEVACGAFHTALLTYKKSSSDKLESVCWTFGLGDNGQLGHGTTQSALSPEPVEELPKTVSLLSVGCGLFHTSVVSSTGDVWSWGMEKGLGLCPEASFSRGDAGDAISPRLISSTKFSGPIQIGCGAAHTILVADGGYKLWSWGRGRSGLLGNGKTIDCIDPSVVLWPPLSDLKEEEIGKGDDKIVAKDPEQVKEYEIKLFTAMEEMKLMQTKLSIMERYASILHGSIFGKPFDERDIPVSLQKSGTFDIAKEWENMLESSDHGKLVRLEMFYRHMLGDIKDKLMKKRIKEIIKECLDSSATGRE